MIIFDIEGDGLFPSVLWCGVTLDYKTKEIRQYSDHDDSLPSMEEFIKALQATDILIGHNIIRWDILHLERLYNISLSDKKVIDTLILSRLNNLSRPATRGKHGLDPWGEYVGVSKPPVEDWTQWFPHMIHRCTEDVKINEKVYDILVKEAKALTENTPLYREAMRVEHEVAKLSAQQTSNGWLFDFKECERLIKEITQKMLVIEKEIEPHLNPITRIVDVDPKVPKYKRNGEYTAVSARIIAEFLGYNVEPADALRAEPPMQPGEMFQRTQVVEANMGNQDAIREYAESLGVKWTQYNWKKQGNEFIKMSPKMNDIDLLRIDHPHTKMIAQYYTLRSRRSIFQGWLEQKDGDGRLRGDVNDMGAKSFRQTHKVFVNIPSPKAEYGTETRKMFICPPDKTIISADGKAYQIRLLAHYLGSEDYTDTVLHGDAHARHAEAMGISRDLANPVFFATIYGAGAGKVASYTGSSQSEGKITREKLINGIPGFSSLLQKAKQLADRRGYIKGLDGRKVFVEESYKATNYLIQSAEAILMKATIVMIAEGFRENNIDFKQLLFYHDEVSYEIDPKDTEKAEEIIRHAFSEAPKKYGVNIMEAGDIKVGDNYYAVH